MATQTVETEPGPRPGLPSPIPRLDAAQAFRHDFGFLRPDPRGRRFCRDDRPSANIFFRGFRALAFQILSLQILYFLTGFGHQALRPPSNAKLASRL